MPITTVVLENIIAGYNSREERPSGQALSLSRYQENLSAEDFNSILAKYGWENRINSDALLLSEKTILSALGFDSVWTMDYSSFEGADFVWDLNNPSVPTEHCERYDFIFDTGTLEHVFHLPNALEAIFNMLKPGGTFFFNQPGWWRLNHGFRCNSPKLFYEYFLSNKWLINSFAVYTYFSLYGPYQKWELSEEEIRSFEMDIRGCYCAVMGSATKISESTSSIIPIENNYLNEWEIEGNVNKKIKNIFSKKSGGHIYLYGTGRRAFNIVNCLNSNERKVLERGGVIGRTSDEIGKYLVSDYAILIHDISVVKTGDTVIISSKVYQDQIYYRIKHLEKEGIEIIRLY